MGGGSVMRFWTLGAWEPSRRLGLRFPGTMSKNQDIRNRSGPLSRLPFFAAQFRCENLAAGFDGCVRSGRVLYAQERAKPKLSHSVIPGYFGLSTGKPPVGALAFPRMLGRVGHAV